MLADEVHILEFNDEMAIIVVSSTDRHYLAIDRFLSNGDTFADRASGDYHNALILGEALRDAIGFGPAQDLLRANGVAEDHPIMRLGRKG